MTVPTYGNDFESLLPEEENKGTPVQIRHRDVGPRRPSNPELQEIFKHGENLASSSQSQFSEEGPIDGDKLREDLDRALNDSGEIKNSDDVVLVKPQTRGMVSETRREVTHKDRIKRGDFIPPDSFRHSIEDIVKKDPMKFGMFSFDVSTARTPEGLKSAILKYVQKGVLSSEDEKNLLNTLASSEGKETKKEVLPWSNEGGKLFYYLGSKSNSTSAEGKVFKNLQFAIDHLQTSDEVQSVLETYKDRMSEDEFNKISNMVGNSAPSAAPILSGRQHQINEHEIKPTTIKLSSTDIDKLEQMRPQPIMTIPPVPISETISQIFPEDLKNAEVPPPLPQWYIEQEGAKRKERAAQRNVEKVWDAITRVEAFSPGHAFTINTSGNRVSLVEGLTPEECQMAFRDLVRQGKLMAFGNEYRVKVMESEDTPEESALVEKIEEVPGVAEHLENKNDAEDMGTQEIPAFGIENKEASPEDVSNVWSSIKSGKYASPFITLPDGPHSSVPSVPSNERVQSAFEELVRQGKLQPTSSKDMYSVIQNNPVPFEPALMASDEVIEDFKPLTSDADREQGFKWEIMNKIDKQVHENKLKRQEELEQGQVAETFTTAEHPAHEETQAILAGVEASQLPEKEFADTLATEEDKAEMSKNAEEDRKAAEKLPLPLPAEYVAEMERQEYERNTMGEVQPPSLEKVLSERLDEYRDMYAAQNINWKNNLREKKKWYQKIASDMGFAGRKLPELEKPAELVDAEKKYIEVKRDLRMNLFKEKHQTNFIEQTEKENEKLQRRILERLPPVERGIISKSFEKWAKIPLPARLALSTALMTGIGYYFGSEAGSAYGAASSGALRAGRAVLGAVTSQIVGKKVDAISKKNAEERKQKALEAYVQRFDPDNFEESEHKMMEFFEKEENQKKRDQVKKAAIMMATGVGATAAISEAGSALSHVLYAGDAVHIHADQTLGGPHASHVPEIKTPTAAPELNTQPVSVELSSKGFIDTFAHLKAQIAAQYPDIHTAPPEAQHILSTSPEKLAQEYGLYKPGETFQSAVGLKGDHITLDVRGDLVLEQKSTSQMLFDAQAGKIHVYKGAMLDANSGSVANPPIAEAHLGMPEHVVPVDLISGKAPLDAKYQFDPAYKDMRNVYNINFEKSLIDLPVGEITYRLPIDYMGGRIQIIQHGNHLSALLNGQKIAEGTVSQNGPGLTFDKSLGKGMFGTKSEYEQAFDKALSEVYKRKDNFKMAV